MAREKSAGQMDDTPKQKKQWQTGNPGSLSYTTLPDKKK